MILHKFRTFGLVILGTVVQAKTIGNQSKVFSGQVIGFKGGTNTSAPNFTATNMQGRTFQLANLRGKVVMLNFGRHGADGV
jgi:cytochrome oxidase Cu insertion factor (SCO1/SenC/PrrC family)